MSTSVSVDKAFLGFPLAAAVATFAEISKKRPGFLNTILPSFLVH